MRETAGCRGVCARPCLQLDANISWCNLSVRQAEGWKVRFSQTDESHAVGLTAIWRIKDRPRAVLDCMGRAVNVKCPDPAIATTSGVDNHHVLMSREAFEN